MHVLIGSALARRLGNVLLAQDKVCLLVMIGVRADRTKELVALADRHRESTDSWADLLRDFRRRGMRAVGDGALGSGPCCATSSPRRSSKGAGGAKSAT